MSNVDARSRAFAFYAAAQPIMADVAAAVERNRRAARGNPDIVLAWLSPIANVYGVCLRRADIGRHCIAVEYTATPIDDGRCILRWWSDSWYEFLRLESPW